MGREGDVIRRIPLEHDWLFGGQTEPGATRPDFDDSGFRRVSLPHANAAFSWRDFDRSRYQRVCVYRRHFSLPAYLRDRRVFVDFEGAMAASTVTINGHRFEEYRGGYTPFSFELTPHLRWEGDNVLAVEVDSRRMRDDVPPFGGRFPSGEVRTDFDTFGGLYREVSLRVVPRTFIESVFAKPVEVLSSSRSLEVRCSLDGPGGDGFALEAELLDGERVLAGTRTEVRQGAREVELYIGGLGGIDLWDVDYPKLYDVRARLLRDGEYVDSLCTRAGFREAIFTPGGLFLNGRRVQLFGLNRHELFPYVGGAMPSRVQRRDAEILKHELNCNVVRTSHYPQSPHFLDACDEIGLLVWEELPGWQHVGDEAWQEVATEHARKMILRDRNHPSIVLWGVRINESEEDHPRFYDNLNRLAHDLDGSRQTTGAYNKDHPLRQDVWGQNDYGNRGWPLQTPDHSLYLVSEAVGQKNPEGGFRQFYRRTDPAEIQQAQAMRHAVVHDAAAADERNAGVIAWCAFDYNSPHNASDEVKTPGVSDLFRIPKPAANFYRSQRDPRQEAVLEPAFYWDFGPGSPPDGPGEDAMICSNCDQLEVYVDGENVAMLEPDHERFPNLPYPPFFVDLTVGGASNPELRIDGFIGEKQAISRSFSADTSQDRLILRADDAELNGDGIDMTRVVFRAVDRHGAPRPYATGEVRLDLEGPGEIVGDNPFALEPAGGAGAVWVRTARAASSAIRVRATHPALGAEEIEIEVQEIADPDKFC